MSGFITKPEVIANKQFIMESSISEIRNKDGYLL